MANDTFICAEKRLDTNGTNNTKPGPKHCPLTKVVQHIRTSYVNPVNVPAIKRNTDGTTPLPKHYWEIHKIRDFNKANQPLDAPLVIRSKLSNADGVVN